MSSTRWVPALPVDRMGYPLGSGGDDARRSVGRAEGARDAHQQGAAAHGGTEHVEPSGGLVHQVASRLLIAVE
jgi:hypothetical protein